MALLAAAALDRQRALSACWRCGATGLLAVAFLPVFTGFAAENSGLVSCRASATSGGRGAACHRLPGRRLLQPQAAVADHGSLAAAARPCRGARLDARPRRGASSPLRTSATTARPRSFPTWRVGHVAAPFTLLGDQARYQAPGRQARLFAYRLGAELYTQPIFPGVDACIESSPGAGKTAPARQGRDVEVAGADIVGRGHGFRRPDRPVPRRLGLLRTAHDVVDTSSASSSTWTRTFQLDEIGGDAAHGYTFAPIASRGSIEVTYTVDSTGLSVAVRPLWLDARLLPGRHPQRAVGGLRRPSRPGHDRTPPGRRTFRTGWPPAGPGHDSSRAAWACSGLCRPCPVRSSTAGRELTRRTSTGLASTTCSPLRSTASTYHVNVKEAS